MTTDTMNRPAKIAMNGVNVPTLLATIGAVAEQPALAQFTFRARSEWAAGTYSRTRINDYAGAGGEHAREAGEFVVEADHPAVLCGADHGPTPGEYLLAALASCITAGIGNIASARQVTLRSVKGTVEGDADLQGILGIDKTVRNGFSAIRARFEIDGDAPREVLEKIVHQSMARSAVLDMLTNGTTVDVDVAA
ncbi:OsmC family protein [Sulfitobacter sp. D35]|uniref:OsmC family protein n=1 Tax=Sulfitobacter sp. D35 TaxID=3083252 RepID=UPI00296F6A47|nr:OsmC family protein [Sulfitobacter sp. D35]MDW4500351.1 OsmC family protein [Sulfitobacter sp. D35]